MTEQSGLQRALESLTAHLGKPQREAWADHWPEAEAGEHHLHPLFELARIFDEDYGQGYTGNTYRGTHQTVPCWTEEGEVVFIETSFHKGTTFIDVVWFPDAPEEIMAAAFALLSPQGLPQ